MEQALIDAVILSIPVIVAGFVTLFGCALYLWRNAE